MYMSVKQAAEKWGISDRRVRILCSEGKIPGVIREGRESYAQKEKSRELSVRDVVGRFRKRQRNRRMVDIDLQQVC